MSRVSKNRIARSAILAVFAIATVALAIFTTQSASAVSNMSVISKTLYQGIEQCYNSGAFASRVSVNAVTGVESISNANAYNDDINVPTNLVGINNNNHISCVDLFKGNTRVSGLFSVSSKTYDINSPIKDKQEFLRYLGYEPEAGDTQKCVRFKYDYSDPQTPHQTFYSESICADVVGGKINSVLSQSDGENPNHDIVNFRVTNGNTVNFGRCARCGTVTGNVGDNWATFYRQVFNELAANRATFGSEVAGAEYHFTMSTDDDVIDESDSGVYRLKGDAAAVALQSFSGSRTLEPITDDDEASLYITYLKDFYQATQRCLPTGSDGAASLLGQGYREYIIDKSGNQCYIRGGNNLNSRVNVFSGNTLGYENGSFEYLVEWLKHYHGDVDINVDTANTLDPVQNPNRPGSNIVAQNGKIKDLCLENSSADSLSWIVCPAMSGMAEGTDGIYGLIKDMLVVDSTLLSANGESNQAYQIWGMFRDIANVLFVLILLAVIFSQITGVGIDNYGIKKILPRLIVTAVLVNLSFFISQLAVDISNILGGQINLMLSSWANTFSPDGTGVGVASIFEAILASIAGGASATIPFAATLVTAVGSSWWIVIIIILILLVIIVVSVLVVFLMLGARQILVIVAVAIAPVAFICYALPNTEKLFKRWVDIFKAALVLFPLCSLLCGVGQLIQAIVFGANGSHLDTSMALIAAACPFLPFLALPALLRSSLRAVGDLGNRISGIRTRATTAARQANTAIRNTNSYKDAQRNFDMARQQRIVDRTNAALRNGNLSDRQRARYTRQGAMAAQRLKKYEQEDVAARSIIMQRQNPNMILDDIADQWEQAYANGDENLVTLTQIGMERYGSSFAGAIGQRMAHADEEGRNNGTGGLSTNQNMQDSVQRLRTFFNDNGAYGNQLKNKAADAFDAISSGGRARVGNTVGFQDFNHFSAHNSVATSAADWSTQSAATLRRAAESGALTPAMANELLNSNDPSILSGIRSEANKADVLRAVSYMNSHNAPAAQRNQDANGNFTETQMEANIRTYAPMYQASQSQANIDQNYRDAANETFDVTINGQTSKITGYMPRQTTAGNWSVAQNGDHQIGLADGNTWTAETGTLDLTRGGFSQAQQAAFGTDDNGNVDYRGFHYAGQLGNAARYTRTRNGRTIEYIVGPNGHYTVREETAPGTYTNIN